MYQFWRNKKKQALLASIGKGKLPGHIAIIMDGNGRWARKRGLPRVAGHRAGVEAIRRCLNGLKPLAVHYLTLYAFSTENWRRPRSEVEYLMDLPGYFLDRELDMLVKNNIRLGVVGDLAALPAHTRKAVEFGCKKTAGNTGLMLNFALNYGGRSDILQAVGKICRKVAAGQLKPDAVDENIFSNFLQTGGIPDPDLLIRTSGELRISNFLLWQIAYTELFFTDVLWPDFQDYHLYQAIRAYQTRRRRFGGL